MRGGGGLRVLGGWGVGGVVWVGLRVMGGGGFGDVWGFLVLCGLFFGCWFVVLVWVVCGFCVGGMRC